jgi:serine/threonine protein kinase
MQGISEAMVYLFDKKIAYRDMKPQNILILRDISKLGIKLRVLCLTYLADFETAREVGSSRKAKSRSNIGKITDNEINFLGTRAFAAPEVNCKKKQDIYRKSYDTFKADIYSFGLSVLNCTVVPK